MKICSICDRKYYAKNLCRNHYEASKYKAKPRKLKTKDAKAKWRAWSRTLLGQFTTSKNKIKKRNIVWELTKEQFFDIRKGECNYCSGPLPETSIGLDRIIPEIGYIVGNVVPCCRNCNMLKGDMLTKEETEFLIAQLKIIRQGKIW